MNQSKAENNELVQNTVLCVSFQFFRGGEGEREGEGEERERGGRGRRRGRGYLQPREFKTTHLSLRTRPTTRTQFLCFASESKTAQREVYRLLYKFGLVAQEHFLCILH